MAEQLQPYVTIDHRPNFGWRWTGHNPVDAVISWGHGFLTKRLAEEAGEEWLKDQQAKAKVAKARARRAARAARKDTTNGKGKRGNVRNQ
jgi:hypothetical protein